MSNEATREVSGRPARVEVGQRWRSRDCDDVWVVAKEGDGDGWWDVRLEGDEARTSYAGPSFFATHGTFLGYTPSAAPMPAAGVAPGSRCVFDCLARGPNGRCTIHAPSAAPAVEPARAADAEVPSVWPPDCEESGCDQPVAHPRVTLCETHIAERQEFADGCRLKPALFPAPPDPPRGRQSHAILAGGVFSLRDERGTK